MKLEIKCSSLTVFQGLFLLCLTFQIYVVVNFLSQVIFLFVLFLGMVMLNRKCKKL